jgi:hypothetical protein
VLQLRRRNNLPLLVRLLSVKWKMKEKMRSSMRTRTMKSQYPRAFPHPRGIYRSYYMCHAHFAQSAEAALSRVKDVDIKGGWKQGTP